MGYQIVATPSFSGAWLPALITPGFRDDFDRPDSLDLGVTSRGGRAWELLPSVEGANIVPQVKDGQLAATGTTGYVLGTAEAYAADVLVEATIAYTARDAALTPNLRVAARCSSAAPAAFASVRWSNQAGSEYLWLDTYGTRLTVQSGVLGDLTGRRVGLKAQGDEFTVYLDGEQVIAPTTAPGIAGVTRHGFQASNSANAARLDDITVTPL